MVSIYVRYGRQNGTSWLPRQRLGEEWRKQVAPTVGKPADVDKEIGQLSPQTGSILLSFHLSTIKR